MEIFGDLEREKKITFKIYGATCKYHIIILKIYIFNIIFYFRSVSESESEHFSNCNFLKGNTEPL